MGIIITELAVAIGIPVLGGLFVSQLTQESIVTWYRTISKPSWNPPAIIFAPIWTVLYALLGVASYQVWQVGVGNAWALKLYLAQLALNFLWPLVFFNMRNLSLSVLVNLALLATSLATQGAFYRVHPEAGQLMMPYIIWLCFANLLNFVVWRRNPHGGEVTTTDAPSTVATDNPKQVSNRGEDYGPIGPTTASAEPRRAAPIRISNPQLAAPARSPMLRTLRTRQQVTARRAAPRMAARTMAAPRMAASAPALARALC
mmetsp:Transcript_8550/g.25605  ORF Transcript_8550/g.25605 Transcript_8550/m.25605 type:complete len:259 (-) Transcript_8550:296-1072(-)|eukprot:CAMPEP_0206149566 /NCGR_PEP_ID=MMETSP1473-20131121/37851_1 /ASSEMBLY_ACC=CAM_ASM_001109 /TAXON_ID=1461547 /ORGANISM="Stichococcus sp, Strain RCC1054" /LENGTH=258 /DNA_ID=CAMNT_0053547041 /DNA_START=644 /DNA_END=1420 /DNA_ORIENTATION=-